MLDRLDPDARTVFETACTQAEALRHPYAGTEHLLLALALTPGPAADRLAAHGCGPAAVRDDVVRRAGAGGPPAAEPERLLASLGIDLDEVRRRAAANFGADAVHNAARRTRGRARRRWWPGRGPVGPCRPALLAGERPLPLAPRLKRVLEIATRAATPAPATPSDVLAAIVAEGNGLACRILADRGVDLAELATPLPGRRR